MPVYDVTVPLAHAGLIWAEVDCRLVLTYTPGAPERGFGRPEDYDPGCAAEVEVARVLVQGVPEEGPIHPVCAPAPQWLADLATAYALDKHLDALLEVCAEDQAAVEEAALERLWEERREGLGTYLPPAMTGG